MQSGASEKNLKDCELMLPWVTWVPKKSYPAILHWICLQQPLRTPFLNGSDSHINLYIQHWPFPILLPRFSLNTTTRYIITIWTTLHHPVHPHHHLIYHLLYLYNKTAALIVLLHWEDELSSKNYKLFILVGFSKRRRWSISEKLTHKIKLHAFLNSILFASTQTRHNFNRRLATIALSKTHPLVDKL